ncbi:PEP-CTERM sorting domain-containing protein [Roseateles cellulosilyticus]|uniref:PEP-CTERM sorting domain-containing protein n=1 Tax=Pelomonas cellulosilytica TaxID=2906762 RepID=A0ABS8XU90_9BURK|nr:PEP-CTERM sorting domain-containing protein [Pelomonas sp. P8]MCE4556247.1 PEP-CTERM sorting domain-containing protein [Pelomonas sp. P8]
MKTRPLAALAAIPLCLAVAMPAHADYGVDVGADRNEGGGSYQISASVNYSSVNVMATASADLDHGALHAYAYSTNDPVLRSGCAPYELQCNWGTTATAALWDVITLKPSAQGAPSTFNYSFSIDGTKTPGKWWSWNAVYASYYFGVDPNGWTHPSGLSGDDDSVVEGTFEAPTSGPLKIYFFERISVRAEGGAVTDYSNTMKFDWELPPGWTYTSESGAFMRAVTPTSPVPEPASAALLLGGLALLGARTRRR